MTDVPTFKTVSVKLEEITEDKGGWGSEQVAQDSGDRLVRRVRGDLGTRRPDQKRESDRTSPEMDAGSRLTVKR